MRTIDWSEQQFGATYEDRLSNVMFPTDARLLNRAREILVRLAKRYGVELRQSYARAGSR